MTSNFQKIHEDEKWLQKGVDIWLIRDNLKLSYEQRVQLHQNTIDFTDELKRVTGMRPRYAKPSSFIKITHS